MKVHKVISGELDAVIAQTRQEVTNILMRENHLDEDEQQALIELYCKAVDGKARRNEEGDAVMIMLIGALGFLGLIDKLGDTGGELLKLAKGINEIQTSADLGKKKKRKKD